MVRLFLCVLGLFSLLSSAGADAPQHFVRMSTGLRSLGSSVRESRGGVAGWQHAGTVDLAVSQAV